MALVRSQIDVRIASTKGHVVHLKAGVPAPIPDELLPQAYAMGCIPVQETVTASADAPAGDEPSDGMSIDDAVRMILEENDMSKLKAEGTPKTTAVRALGVKATTAEVNEAFVRVAPTVEAFRAREL